MSITTPISADDPNAIQKLEDKLEDLQWLQDQMKAANAYYRKHKTLDGCPGLSPEQIEKLKSIMPQKYDSGDKPFPAWKLSNNSAEIRRVKARIEQLTKQREVGYVGWEFDGGTVEANQEENRLQIFFDEKPDEDVRWALKAHGFRWAPSAGAWQRQLNDGAIYAADRIRYIQPISGKKPSELQPKKG